MLLLNGRVAPRIRYPRTYSICTPARSGKGQVVSQSKSVFRPGLHVFLDVYFLMRFDMQYFYQRMTLQDSQIAIRDGPQKKRKMGQFHPCLLEDYKLITSIVFKKSHPRNRNCVIPANIHTSPMEGNFSKTLPPTPLKISIKVYICPKCFFRFSLSL